MKIILSRKGFDSSKECGQTASPILPDGSMISMPIPSKDAGSIPYNKICTRLGTLGDLATDLTRFRQPNYRLTATSTAHLDPDLGAAALTRREGWLPIFGQAEAAQSHLANQKVSDGDLFLFYGWFRKVERDGGCYKFVRGAPHRHVIFGWLQIGKAYDAAPSEKANAPQWARYHAHFANDWKNNKVYVARDKLDLEGLNRPVSGGGVFQRFSDEQCLTAPGESRRSVWLLPRCFDRLNFTYHNEGARWTQRGDDYHLQTVAKGQEFVIDTTNCPKVIDWVRRLFN